MADVSRGMKSMCFNHFLLKLLCFKSDPVQEQRKAQSNDCFLGFLLAIFSCLAFLAVVPIYLSFHNLGSQLFLLEDAPLALGPNFGPSIEFWVQLPLLKTQAHVAIALGTTHGTSTKTPLILSYVSHLFCVLWFQIQLEESQHWWKNILNGNFQVSSVLKFCSLELCNNLFEFLKAPN